VGEREVEREERAERGGGLRREGARSQGRERERERKKIAEEAGLGERDGGGRDRTGEVETGLGERGRA
jgi:hypothetical protein